MFLFHDYKRKKKEKNCHACNNYYKIKKSRNSKFIKNIDIKNKLIIKEDKKLNINKYEKNICEIKKVTKQEKELLNDFNYVLKINNLHPSELWKNLNINEINLLMEVLSEYSIDNPNISL